MPKLEVRMIGFELLSEGNQNKVLNALKRVDNMLQKMPPEVKKPRVLIPYSEIKKFIRPKKAA